MSLPAGERIYAVGDIHGCLDKLLQLHRAIRADLAAYPIARPLIVHLGDYIDRGPDSAGVVRALMGMVDLPMVNLMGNHEYTALAALGPCAVGGWTLRARARPGTCRRLSMPGWRRCGRITWREAISLSMPVSGLGCRGPSNRWRISCGFGAPSSTMRRIMAPSLSMVIPPPAGGRRSGIATAWRLILARCLAGR